MEQELWGEVKEKKNNPEIHNIALSLYFMGQKLRAVINQAVSYQL